VPDPAIAPSQSGVEVRRLSSSPADMAQLQFVSFSSWVDSSFWHALSQEKIDKEGLNDRPRPVLGAYDATVIGAARPRARLEVPASALSDGKGPLGYCQASGTIKNFNTFEMFKSSDKNELLRDRALELWNAIHDGTIYDRLSLLSMFTILSFADLKKYKFIYWFAFPAIVTPWKLDEALGTGVEELVEERSLNSEVLRWRQTEDVIQHGFFTVRWRRAKGTGTSGWEVGSLAECEHDFLAEDESGDTMVGFVDPSFHASAPGWPIRNLLALASYRWKLSRIRILCLRDNLAQFKAFDGTEEANRFHSNNVIMSFALSGTLSSEMPNVVGWERNAQSKLSPRLADLAPMMDPRRLADTAVDLNLKLMKWRILPQLKLDKIKETKCLLLGAGTLGSYVARSLLAWGVRTVTLVDSATVSFSNPVRQPLYTFQDCFNGGKAKAPAAAQSLKQIYPGVEATGFQLSVPMLGHPSLPTTADDFRSLEELFDRHDAIFLLMDSRESRWLPTVMGAAKNKIVINAALGFDTHVVLRHGMRTQKDRLGCYFCNDVVAPVDVRLVRYFC